VTIGAAVWQVVVETAERSGVRHVKPHDLRRTLATELLETGTPAHHVQAHVQAQLGRANAQTMLQNYTGKIDAQARRRSGRVRYG
jgi:integrase